MTTRNTLEASYLKHILIATEARDNSAPFRTFFDNWFAFREGGPFLNGNSRPHWYNNPCPDKHGEALRRADFVSAAAARTLGGFAHERLMRDHAVPVSVLRDIIFDEQPETVEEVRAIMLKHYRCGIIIEEEDHKLGAAGLRSRMPDSWGVKDSAFARYESVGIVAQDQSRPTAAVNLDTFQAIRSKKPQHRLAQLLNSTVSKPLSNSSLNG